MKSFLAGDLAGDEEERISRHLENCPACERLAGELSDDAEARRFATAGSQAAASHDADSLDDLRRRLHVLGLLDARVYDDAGSARQGPGGTVAVRLSRDTPPHAPPLAAEPPGRRGPEPPLPPRLGHFEIVRQIGAGGFGVVYLAQDLRLQRPVALKAARASVLADPGQRERFFREAEALARLQHPHITPVYEVDEIDGICFLAMAWCDGPTLDQWLREQQRPLESQLAARLVLCLAEAVQHAHEHGILHRDIKPANVLLAAGQGEMPFTPLLTDFGLAKVLDEPSTTTLSGVVLGTPQYMAPEQAAGHLERIGPATDVYALGAVLYQLLTGQPPIEGNSMVDTLRRLLIDDPVEIRRLAPEASDDLAAIAMKCLEKSPRDRYATASELADDLRRFLSGRPTKARPLSHAQRAGRFLRRHRQPVALASLAVLAVGLAVGLLAYASLLSRWQDTAARYAEQSDALQEEMDERGRRIAEAEYVGAVAEAARLAGRGDLSGAVAALASQIPAEGQADQRGLAWHYLWALCTHQPLASDQVPAAVYHIARCPVRPELAVVGKDDVVRLYEPERLTLLAHNKAGHREINGAAYSPDGSLLATVGDDGEVCLWSCPALVPQRRWQAHDDLAFSAVFLEGGAKLATCGNDPVIKLWDVATGELLGTLEQHTNAVETIRVSPDGALLASGARDGQAILWDWQAREPVHRLAGHSRRVSGLAFSPDGRMLATASGDKEVRLWDVASGECLGARRQIDELQSVAFSADGTRLLVGDRKGKLCDYRLRETEGGTVAIEQQSLDDAWLGHRGTAWFLVSAAADEFYSAGHDGGLHRWGPHQPSQRVLQTALPAGDDPLADLAFSADGQRLFVLRARSGVAMLDPATLETLRTFEAPAASWQAMAILEGRGEVAAGSSRGDILVWNWRSGAPRRIDSANGGDIVRLAHSPQAGLLAVVAYDQSAVRLLDVVTGEPRGLLPAENFRTAAFSPDGKLLAVDSLGDIRLYDPVTQALRLQFSAHTSTIHGLEFSRDGALLASCSGDRTVQLWTLDGTLLVPVVHSAGLIGVEFTPDDKTLVSADEQGGLKLAYVPPSHGQIDIPLPATRLKRLAVAPDNRRVALIDIDGNLLIVGAYRP